MNRREDDHYTYNTYKPVKLATWWLRNLKYFLFMMRELTSVFVALFVLLFLYELFLLSKGESVHALFQQSLRSAPFIVFYVVTLIFALYHTITWFGVLGRVQEVKLGKAKMPPALVTAGAFGGWIVASIVVAYLFVTL